jgi:hypothetical protein
LEREHEYYFRPGMYERGRQILDTCPVPESRSRDRASAQAGRKIKVSDATFGELSVEFRYRTEAEEDKRRA